jgi:hypothetical protein
MLPVLDPTVGLGGGRALGARYYQLNHDGTIIYIDRSAAVPEWQTTSSSEPIIDFTVDALADRLYVIRADGVVLSSSGDPEQLTPVSGGPVGIPGVVIEAASLAPLSDGKLAVRLPSPTEGWPARPLWYAQTIP